MCGNVPFRLQPIRSECKQHFKSSSKNSSTEGNIISKVYFGTWNFYIIYPITLFVFFKNRSHYHKKLKHIGCPGRFWRFKEKFWTFKKRTITSLEIFSTTAACVPPITNSRSTNQKGVCMYNNFKILSIPKHATENQSLTWFM